MSARSRAAVLARRLPFGIGTVVLVLCATLVAIGGVVLAIDAPRTQSEYAAGQLRNYTVSPDVAWTMSNETLPGYAGTEPIRVEDTAGDRWLLSYPVGIGRGYVVVDRGSGTGSWDQPINAGLGDCAFTATGQLGCAIRLAAPTADGFYLVDDDGMLTERSPLHDTARVVGVDDDFLRINQVGYQVTMTTPAGGQLWRPRTFATAVVDVRVTDGVLILSTADGGQFALDPGDGTDLLSCTRCQMQTYDGGLVVTSEEYLNESVTTYAITRGGLDPEPVVVKPGLRVIPGPALLPVLTAANQVFEEYGRFEILDPASGEAIWQIGDNRLSKENTRPCGELVAFALGDGSRATYTLADGERVGRINAPEPGAEVNANAMNCVGSSGTTMVLADNRTIAAYGADGRLRWQESTDGAPSVVDGYIVRTLGTSISVLRPS